MVIGNGSIANSFIKDYINDQDILIFAAGVSNSNEINSYEFKREEQKLINSILDNRDKKIIYFSSAYVDIIDTIYYKHKKSMENIIINNAKKYLIIRLPQIASFSGNKNNLMNYLKNKIIKKEKIILYKNTFRSLIDIDDMVNIVNVISKKINNQIIIIYEIEPVNVVELTNKIGNIIGIEPIISMEEKKDKNFSLKNSEVINETIDYLKINNNHYLDKLLKKYINGCDISGIL